MCVCDTAAAPGGTLWALDLSITAMTGPETDVHAHLERSSKAKASWSTPGGARGPPDSHTLVPLIYSADHPWINLEALGFLQPQHGGTAASRGLTYEDPLGQIRPHSASGPVADVCDLRTHPSVVGGSCRLALDGALCTRN